MTPRPRLTAPASFVRDGFRTARGGRAALLQLVCERCDTPVALYQKDGPGPLKRLYIDRIVSPPALAHLAPGRSAAALQPLVCPTCGELLGMPMRYEKEGRLAFRLFQSVLRKVRVPLARSRSRRSP